MNRNPELLCHVIRTVIGCVILQGRAPMSDSMNSLREEVKECRETVKEMLERMEDVIEDIKEKLNEIGGLQGVIAAQQLNVMASQEEKFDDVVKCLVSYKKGFDSVGVTGMASPENDPSQFMPPMDDGHLTNPGTHPAEQGGNGGCHTAVRSSFAMEVPAANEQRREAVAPQDENGIHGGKEKGKAKVAAELPMTPRAGW